MLHKYWITFDKSTNASFFNLGCGVTAYNEEDALELLRDRFAPEDEIPEVAAITEIHALDQLEKNHVMPNISNPVARGVWFPMS